MNFSELGLNEAIIKSLDENKIVVPSEIQTNVIPIILNTSKNILAVSQTGTGKTAAYGLPILQQINVGLQQTQVLILVPTRELGQQIAKDLFVFSRYIVRIHTEAVFGGKKIEEQIKKLATPKHILVATPGRLLDLISKNIVDLSYLKFIVLDEADIMLNMGFKPDIDKVMRICKSNVRKLLFTSTFPSEIKKISKDYLGTDIAEIQVKPQEFVNINIEHLYIPYQYGYKLEFLKAFLKDHLTESGIIFCRTQAAVKLLNQQLAGFEAKTDCLHGELSQFDRTKAMSAFKSKRVQILIATDIASRGIDVQDLRYVVHFHLPNNDAEYVNRSGRTARAGKKGISVCLIQEDELFQKDKIETNLNIKFKELKQNPIIDKIDHDHEITFSINLGARKEFTADTVKRFVSDFSGIKLEHIYDVLLLRLETEFVINAKYKEQLISNLHNSKHFHQRILIEEIEQKQALI